MPQWDTIAIVGVGLIGGSIGLAVRENGVARHVIGVGRRASRLRKARVLGAVTATTTRLPRGVADAELIILCTPVDDIVPRACAVAEHAPPGALITDVGSTKAIIVDQLAQQLDKRATFIGSHPLAGSDRSGVAHARADLFQGRVTVVTPTKSAPPSDVVRLKRFWQQLGASVIEMTPSQHDRSLAMTSHAAHIIASALAVATDASDLPLAGTGWADTTRIAAADPELWRQILFSNQDAILKSLDKFEKVLSSFRSALGRADETQITQLLEAGKQTRDSLGS